MPQMAPLSWLFLFIMFIFLFLLFNSVNYFMFSYDIKKYTPSTKKMKINWKW